MKMRVVLAIFVMMVSLSPLGQSLPDDQSPKSVENWFKKFPHNAQPKLTKLHFYLYNIVSKNPPNSAPVAQASTTPSTPVTSFGLVNVLDGPLREKPGSEIIGYSQGLFTFASQENRATLMTLNFVFTAGPFKGSTLSVLGHNLVTAKYREFPIIGGSGDFRLAQGIGTASSYFVNATSGDDILEMSFVFYRYPLAGDSELVAEE
ncbi:OLC1v1013812C1 [Oldenlandia corymbosa var. corymbosa]|uniref:Dirigent protein n=1 Tax=Oldenlandia corymbosa var. corymbosa TaxID=529605 RepID=A0AAV1E025_OLDCO|nr:OLC1v1013812C1 [Oldenlandia corymbosa var. corymbosa]